MLLRHGKVVLATAAAVILLTETSAWAWGPATHVNLACEVLGQLNLLPAALAVLLRHRARDFIYGNIAADFVFAKKLSRIKQFCHHWATGYALLEEAETDAGRAFAHGYLAHLAADTVAHNKFLPRQLTITRTTHRFGHLYWEIRADCLVDVEYRAFLAHLLRDRFHDHEDALEASLTDTLLPFELNRRVFRRMNLTTTNRAWQGTMRRWHAWSRWDLDADLVARYCTESVERIVTLLAEGPSCPLLHEDPNGNAALGFARHHRRQLRQMARAGIIAPHVWDEVTAHHDPAPFGDIVLDADATPLHPQHI